MAGTHWATEVHVELPIKLGTEGAAARKPITVYDMFRSTVQRFGEESALRYKDLSSGVPVDDAPWVTLSWAQYYIECLRFAKSLMSLGFAPHRCTNILGFNSVEWFIANLGSIAAGGVPAGIYTTNLPEACKYVTQHSEAEVVVVENKMQLDKYVKVASELNMVKAMVIYRGDVPEGLDLGFPVYTWAQFMELGSEILDSSVEERINAQKPGMACSLIYTSGTTGPPKAAMISHDNITWISTVQTSQFAWDSTERLVSYLPLSHVAAQVVDMYGPMAKGISVSLAQPDALKGSLVKTLREVRPTIFFGVPRVWEKMYEKMQEVGRSITGIKKSVSTWSKAKGLQHARMHEYGGGGGTPCGFTVANSLAFSRVKTNLGLDQAHTLFTGAAPISSQILEYFASLNMHIYEVFGQSESTGPHTVNKPEAWKMGTVGRPVPGSESKLEKDTGELCYRGRHIFMGYMHNPAKTAETIDEDGWMHSGDVVTFDEDEDPDVASPSGFIRITGRIKELIVTAGGENVPPVLIEAAFKKNMPCISNCMVVGDKRKFLTILIALKVEVDDDGVPSDKLTGESLVTCERIGSTATTVQEAKEDPKWTEYVDGGMKACNENTTSNAQKIAKWAFVLTDFSVDGGELTPTLKLKRAPTHKKYADIIEALYA